MRFRRKPAAGSHPALGDADRCPLMSRDAAPHERTPEIDIRRTHLRFASLTTVALAAFAATACADDITAPTARPFGATASVTAPEEACGEATSVTLLAGQYTEAGLVTVWNDADSVYVRYSTTDGWQLKETHLAVALDIGGIPSNKSGNPVVGKFAYKTTHEAGVTEYTYAIALADVGATDGSELFIAAHGVVVQAGGGSETAWGEGTRFEDQGNWGMYFSRDVGACDGDDNGGGGDDGGGISF